MTIVASGEPSIPVTIVYDDIAKAGYCASGARRWFEAHGLDFKDFIENGIDADVLLATGDAMAERVVALKRERTNG